MLTILSAFLDGEGSQGVTVLSRRLAMTKSMVHRGLTNLAKHNYVVRDESGSRYQLGFALAEFGTLSVRPPDLHRLCRPAMERLCALTGETVTLHIQVDGHVVCVDGVDGRGPVARRVPLGRGIPLHASPASRAVLAHLPAEEVDRYLRRPLEVFTDRTLRTPREIWSEIHRTRADGYARDLGDHVSQAIGAAVAFPVLDMNGEPHGSITVAGPVDRFPVQRIEALLEPMLEVMRDLSRAGRLYLSSREPVSDPGGSDRVQT